MSRAGGKVDAQFRSEVTVRMRRNGIGGTTISWTRGLYLQSRHFSERQVMGQAGQNRLSGRRYCRQQTRLTRGLELPDL